MNSLGKTVGRPTADPLVKKGHLANCCGPVPESEKLMKTHRAGPAHERHTKDMSVSC